MVDIGIIMLLQSASGHVQRIVTPVESGIQGELWQSSKTSNPHESRAQFTSLFVCDDPHQAWIAH